jgi:hypothetical protein
MLPIHRSYFSFSFYLRLRRTRSFRYKPRSCAPSHVFVGRLLTSHIRAPSNMRRSPGYRQQGGRGREQTVAARPRRAFKSFRSAKIPPGHPKRAYYGRDLLRQTFVCVPKLTRQQYNKKRCDVVKNYLVPFATPSICRTSVCLGASSRLASCPGPGQSRVSRRP